MAIEFRSFYPEDKEELKELLFQTKDDYLPPNSEEERSREIENLLNRKERAVLALENNKIIGIIGWKASEEDPEVGYISIILVHKKHRNRGIGTKLYRIVMLKLDSEGYKKINYTTWDTNEVMIHLSEKLGIPKKKEYLDEKYRGKGRKTLVFEKEI